MLITIYAIIAILIFLILGKKIDFRRYYSTLLTICYLRFLEQFVLVYMLNVWEYDNLPLPLSSIINVPVLMDITLYPLLAYFFIQYIPEKPLRIFAYYFLFSFTLLGLEASLVWADYLVHKKEWNYIFSYYLSFVTFLIIHWQYKLFLQTGWYTNSPRKIS